MRIRLQQASVDLLAMTVFDHEVAAEGSDPWYFGDVKFEVDPPHQLALIAELFEDAPRHLAEYGPAQIEQGLWCMMGGCWNAAFTGLVWNPGVPLPIRRRVVDSIFPLYDRLLAAYPYDDIDFRHPDDSEHRYATIDYMAPDLLLEIPWFGEPDPSDQASIRSAFLEVFGRLLKHPAPVAQYAALHGLGHLDDPRGAAMIDAYVASLAFSERNERWYAEQARRGDVLQLARGLVASRGAEGGRKAFALWRVAAPRRILALPLRPGIAGTIASNSHPRHATASLRDQRHPRRLRRSSRGHSR